MKQAGLFITMAILSVFMAVTASAATPGTYKSDDGTIKAVVSTNGKKMKVTYKSGAVEVMDVSDKEGTVSIKTKNYSDPNDAAFFGHIQFHFMVDGQATSSIILFGEPTPDVQDVTFAAIPQSKKDIINSAKLSPRITGREELDKLVSEKLDELIQPEWTNDRKLQAIYNYATLGDALLPVIDSDAWRADPPATALMSYTDTSYAIYFLTNYGGVCDEFTAAFVAMANAAGFEAYDMAGTINGSGHAWALIKFGDSYYLFDPQAESVNMKDSQVRYINYCIPSTTTGSGAYKSKDGCFAEQRKYRKVNKGSVYTPATKPAPAETEPAA